MRALLLAAAAIVTAIVTVGLAGCAQDETPAREQAGGPTSATTTPPKSEPPPTTPPTKPSPPQTSGPSGPSGGDVPVGATQVPAARVDADGLPSYYAHRGEVWVFDHGRSLRMFAMASSGCTDAEAVLSAQSASEVRVTLRALPQPPGARPGRPDGGVCAEVLTPRPVTVTLAEPLGDRTVHLSAGR